MSVVDVIWILSYGCENYFVQTILYMGPVLALNNAKTAALPVSLNFFWDI